MGLIDEISTKRIHIEEKIRGIFLPIWLRSQWFVTPCCQFDHIRNGKYVLMTVDASCRLMLLFLSGSSQESMLWRTLRQFVVYRFRYFLSILYLWKLGYLVVDFPCVAMRSLRSWRYCVVVEWDLAAEPSRAAKPREIPPAREPWFFECRPFLSP